MHLILTNDICLYPAVSIIIFNLMLEEENINIIITIGAIWFLRKYTLPEKRT